MGTRHLTTIYDTAFNERNLVANVYGQWDGYPTGHGAELAKFLGARRMCNGLSDTTATDENGVVRVYANGAGGLAAVPHLDDFRILEQLDGEFERIWNEADVDPASEFGIEPPAAHEYLVFGIYGDVEREEVKQAWGFIFCILDNIQLRNIA